MSHPDQSNNPQKQGNSPEHRAEARRFSVGESQEGQRLDRFLSGQLPELSRSRLSQLISQGQVEVDQKKAKPSQRLRAGNTVHLTIPQPPPAKPEAEALPLSILHEDADLLVINKKAGMVVHPAAGVHSGTLVNALLHHLEGFAEQVKHWEGGDELRPGIVHRLDKDTSGVMVVAKSELAMKRLQQSFQDRRVKKRYLALVHGLPASPATLDTPFGRHPVDRVRMTGKLPPEGNRRAITHYKVLETFAQAASLVDIDLETGRTHQIRVHLAEANHPLLADDTYGGSRRDRRAISPIRHAAATLGRHALHAESLSFVHPRTGAPLHFQAPLPEDFQRALKILRKAEKGES